MDSNFQDPQGNYRDGFKHDNEAPVLPNLDFNASKKPKPIQLLPINVVLPELKYWEEQFGNANTQDILRRRNSGFQQQQQQHQQHQQHQHQHQCQRQRQHQNYHQLKPLVRPSKRQERTPHLKKDSKLSTEAKMSNFKEYIKVMKSQGYTQILMRTRVTTELGIQNSKLLSPKLVMNNWDETVNDIQLQTRALNLDEEIFRTEHALSCQRIVKGQTIEFHFGPVSNNPLHYQLSIFSTAIRQPQGYYRWFHHLKGATYVNLAIFLLGSDFNYSINDNLVEPTIGNDLKVISAKKRCISRLRSHAKSSMIAHPYPTQNGDSSSIMEIQHVNLKLHKLLSHHTFLQL